MPHYTPNTSLCRYYFTAIYMETTASPAVASSAGHGQAYLLTGHKWFTSAPMSDVSSSKQ